MTTRRVASSPTAGKDLWLQIDEHTPQPRCGGESPREDEAPPRFAAGTREVAPVCLDDLARDDQLAQIVHDLKNPLATIALETQVLGHKLARGELGGTSAVVSRIDHNVRFLDRMVHELLDSCAIDARGLELRRLPTELCSLLEDIIDRAVATRDRARVFLQAAIGTVLSIDDLRIERVVANLLSNALKYGPKHSHVVVRLETFEHHVCISVSDGGTAMTARDSQTVFDKYYRAETARPHEGCGLGLYVARKIIEAHGGRIGVECARGAGTRFFFELPR